MNYEQLLEQVVKEGAIRIYNLSGGWSIAYRIKKGEIQGRGIHKVGEGQWALGDHFVGSEEVYNSSGWYPVKAAPLAAKPIMLESAKKNPGYYIGMIRRCESCKLEKSIMAFDRARGAEQSYRSWECNDCASDRISDQVRYRRESGQHVGDYLHRKSQVSRPPIKSEI